MADDEEAVAATAAVLTALIGAAAAAAEEEGGESGGSSMWGGVANFFGGLGRGLTGALAGMPTGILRGGPTGPSGGMTNWGGVYEQKRWDLAGYVRNVAALVKPVEPSAATGETTWANVVVNTMANKEIGTRLREHAVLLNNMPGISAPDAERGKQPDREITVLTVSGPERITIRNPYQEKVFQGRAAARGGEKGALEAANAGPLATLRVDLIPGFSTDSRLKVKLLEALWLCGSNASLADSPACLPIRVLTEVAEAMKYGTAEKAHIAAMKVLGVSYVSRWKEAVERLVAAGAAATKASSASGAVPTGSSSASGAASTKVPDSEAATADEKPEEPKKRDSKRTLRVPLPKPPLRVGGGRDILNPPTRVGARR
jgi:hypothetical protein